MATHRLPILGPGTVPDDGVYINKVKNELTLTGADGEELCFVMPDPNGGGDHGVWGKFAVPKNYVGTPVLVIRGIIDGTVGATNVGFGVTMLGRADNEAYDTAIGTEATASFTSNSYADEDVFEETITITETLAVDDDVTFHLYIDDSVATPFTGNILMTGLFLQYSDA